MNTTVLLGAGLGAIVLAVLLAAVALTAGRRADTGVARGLTAIDASYRRAGPATAGDTTSTLLDGTPGWLRALAARLTPRGVAGGLERRLDLAGNPDGWTADRVLAIKGLGLVMLGTLGAAFGMKSVATLFLYGLAGAAAGFFLPDVLLANAGQKRQEQLRKGLADVLDMLTVCVEAGLGFDAALAQVARNTTGPLAGELSRVLQEMQIGKSRAQALRSLAERTTVPELKAVLSALVQAGELGVPVSQVLREQAREMRVRRRQRAEELAQKVPVKILFPLIVFLLPALFVVILGPGIISMSETLF